MADDIAGHLVLCLREALSNVARHARASTVIVHVSVENDSLTLEVTDDGAGLPAGAVGAGRGLTNMAGRAVTVGGTFTVVAAEPSGTTVTWTAPLQ